MITTEINGHNITTWESIDELPIARYYAFNRFLMLSEGIGSSFSDIEQNHLRPLSMILDDKKKAVQQLANLRELIYNIINDLNFEHRAFCCLVHSVDGEKTVGHSETDIDNLIKRFAEMGVTNGDIKKKMKV